MLGAVILWDLTSAQSVRGKWGAKPLLRDSVELPGCCERGPLSGEAAQTQTSDYFTFTSYLPHPAGSAPLLWNNLSSRYLSLVCLSARLNCLYIKRAFQIQKINIFSLCKAWLSKLLFQRRINKVSFWKSKSINGFSYSRTAYPPFPAVYGLAFIHGGKLWGTWFTELWKTSQFNISKYYSCYPY